MTTKTDFRRNQRGNTAVEYALIIGLIVGATLVALSTWSTEVNRIYATIVESLTVTVPGGT